MFKQLTTTEEHDYRAWARGNYKPGDSVNPLWHPVIRDEIDKINSSPVYNRFEIAIAIQDAGNLRAIAREFVKVVDDAMADIKVTVDIWTDPAVVLFVAKLTDLSGAHRPDTFSRAYDQALRRTITLTATPATDPKEGS